MDHLDRVLAGCCWEVLITRKDPDDSFGALRQAARSLTLASYLAEFVAETLRASQTSQGAPLTDEENIHLLGANYWVQPIYQELLHAASGHNASVEGERKRAGCLEELLILNRPCWPGEDVKGSVLPRSYWQEWWNWESTKKEFQNMATMAGEMWFVDENEAVNRILEIVCRDEIAMAITCKVAKEPDTLKEGRATKRRRKDGLYDKTKAQA